MTCPHCVDAEKLFDARTANGDLKRYRKKGPMRTAQMLLNAVGEAGVDGATLLDVGGGVGALHHELLKAGARSAVDVDGSAAYINASQDESRRVGTQDRITYRFGDFVDMAADLNPVDIVTLDRVVCCYPHMEELMRRSLALSRRLYGLVFPRDTLGARLFMRFGNTYFWLKRSSFRAYIHDPTAIERIVRDAGFECRYAAETLVWHVRLYERQGQEAPGDTQLTSTRQSS